ncbi:MAG: phosphoenolpyruvate--protein phosphotransferase [Rubrivivax sp.]
MIQLLGQAAAPGLALGRIVEWPAAGSEPAPVAVPPRTLPEALEQAAAQLHELRERTDSAEARAILEFQIEFLGDPVLLEPAEPLLEQGAGPAAAWCASIDAQIADFEASEDDYFRHRVGDLRDMRARVLAVLAGRAAAELELPADAIVVADDIAPSRFLATRWGPRQAVLLRAGSPTAHVALLARSRALPMVVALGAAPIPPGCTAIVDGGAGTVELGPDAAALARFERQLGAIEQARLETAQAATARAHTRTGERVQVLMNLSDASELDAVDPSWFDGIGLVRTELMFADGPPDESTQLAAYGWLLRWAGGRPVVVRTLDAGGDKPVPGWSMPHEANPFLGARGVRLSLRQAEGFKMQLRALLRAAAAADGLRIMVPMVTDAAEVTAVRALLATCADELRGAGHAHRMPPLGVMVEVPAAALALDRLGAIDFASIGSNDLLQYTMAAARDNPLVSPLADAAHPGFERLLGLVVAAAASAGIPLSLCGDLAAQPSQVLRLLAAGLRSLSMPAAAVGAVKQAIAGWPTDPPGGRA